MRAVSGAKLEHPRGSRQELERDRADASTEDRAVEQVLRLVRAGRRDLPDDGFLARVDHEQHTRCSTFVTVQGDTQIFRLHDELLEPELALGLRDGSRDGFLVERQKRRHAGGVSELPQELARKRLKIRSVYGSMRTD